MARDALILWRRLDRPGHDACRMWQDAGRCGLDGVAVWASESGPARLAYEVTCGADWITRSVRVQGWVGPQPLSLSIHRDAAGNWRVNGEEAPDIAGLRDIDLSFTPATNTLPLRRLMAAGQDRAELAAAWLDGADWMLKPLPQSYLREGQGTAGQGSWRHASPNHDFQAVLTVSRDGLVTDYPGLWVRES